MLVMTQRSTETGYVLISSLGSTVAMKVDQGLRGSQRDQLKIGKKGENREMLWLTSSYLNSTNAKQELRRLGQLSIASAVIDPPLGVTRIV